MIAIGMCNAPLRKDCRGATVRKEQRLVILLRPRSASVTYPLASCCQGHVKQQEREKKITDENDNRGNPSRGSGPRDPGFEDLSKNFERDFWEKIAFVKNFCGEMAGKAMSCRAGPRNASATQFVGKRGILL